MATHTNVLCKNMYTFCYVCTMVTVWELFNVLYRTSVLEYASMCSSLCDSKPGQQVANNHVRSEQGVQKLGSKMEY